MRELGRLRELSFRAVGEGTSSHRDIDAYDRNYMHLILWDDEELEIVGAYLFMASTASIPAVCSASRVIWITIFTAALKLVAVSFSRDTGVRAALITYGLALPPC